MNVLLVGGTGLLSSAVADEAQRQGLFVTMLTRGRRPVPKWAESIICDCRDHERLATLLGECRFDVVVDFLCYRPDQLRASFSFFSRFTRQYVFISSYAVYDTSRTGLLDEDSPKGGIGWRYGEDKWACERLLEELSRGGDCRYTVVRPSITYGDTRIPYGVMPKYGWHWTLPARILAGKPVLTWNGGRNFINMMHVDDFATGVIGLLGNGRAMDAAFNVCGDEVCSYGQVLDVMEEILGKKVLRVDVPIETYAHALGKRADTFRGGRCHDARNGNDRIKAAVPAFGQRIKLRDGLARTLDALRASSDRRRVDWSFDGMTDRVLADLGVRTGFVDYTGAASRGDRLAYGNERYQGCRVRGALYRMEVDLLSIVRKVVRCSHV